MKTLREQQVIFGVATCAMEQLLTKKMGLPLTAVEIRDNLVNSPYWREFVVLARAGRVPENWLEHLSPITEDFGVLLIDWAKSPTATQTAMPANTLSRNAHN